MRVSLSALLGEVTLLDEACGESTGRLVLEEVRAQCGQRLNPRGTRLIGIHLARGRTRLALSLGLWPHNEAPVTGWLSALNWFVSALLQTQWAPVAS